MSTDGSYLFFYDTGPGKHQSFREEKRTKGGTISGSYGYVDPVGTLRITEYVADREGYRASLEVYKPIHQIGEGPTIIVGPLPADLRSLEGKNKEESVFERFKFPIEPFESLKVLKHSPAKDPKEQLYQLSEKQETSSGPSSGSIPEEKSEDISNNVLEPDTKNHSMSPLDFNSLTINDDKSNLEVMDITALEKELKNLADLLREDPILLIGPLPAHLPDLKSVSSLEIENNEIFESSRPLRSPLKTKTNTSDSFITNINITNSKIYENIESAFKLVIPSSVDDLNYAEKDLVSMGENINAFLRFPSSGLLQGEYIPPRTNKNLFLPQKPIKFNNEPKFDKRNSKTKKLDTLYLSNSIN
ncbi:UNVERIFIED_CONTAM: hypothetical protein RMT77_004052 [Armadillidium vulgare]